MIPEPESINAILREHHRTRLYVQPIAWTMDQPRLLGCHFVRKRLRPNLTKGDGAVSATIEADATKHHVSEVLLERHRLADLILRFGLGRFMTGLFADLLETFNIRVSRFKPVLPFFIGNRVVARIRVDGIFSSGPTNSFLAYLDLDSLESRRQRYIYGKCARTSSEPIEELRDKKLRKIQPLKAEEDPFIVATLIGMAQEQRYELHHGLSGDPSRAPTPPPACSDMGDTEPEIPTSFQVRVIVNPRPRSRFLYVYTAKISSEFLDKFDSPSRSSPSEPIHIEYCKVFVRDPKKLLENLPRALDLSPEQCQGVLAVEEPHSEDHSEGASPTVDERPKKRRKKRARRLDDSASDSP